MGVRPPPSDAGDEPESVDFGIAELDALLDTAEVEFPVTGQELVRELDDPAVDYDPNGRTVALSTALDRVPRERFESRRELMNALHPVFEDLRTGASPGVLGWLRSVLPF